MKNEIKETGWLLRQVALSLLLIHKVSAHRDNLGPKGDTLPPVANLRDYLYGLDDSKTILSFKCWVFSFFDAELSEAQGH